MIIEPTGLDVPIMKAKSRRKNMEVHKPLLLSNVSLFITKTISYPRPESVREGMTKVEDE